MAMRGRPDRMSCDVRGIRGGHHMYGSSEVSPLWRTSNAGCFVVKLSMDDLCRNTVVKRDGNCHSTNFHTTCDDVKDDHPLILERLSSCVRSRDVRGSVSPLSTPGVPLSAGCFRAALVQRATGAWRREFELSQRSTGTRRQ